MPKITMPVWIPLGSGSLLYFASTKAVDVTLEAIQALGGNGYINEYPTGRLLRDAKLYDIGAGTNEIRLMLIGRELYRQAKNSWETYDRN